MSLQGKILWVWHHRAPFQVWWCNNCWVAKCTSMRSSRLNLISAKWFGEDGQLAQRAYLFLKKKTDKSKTCIFPSSLCILPLSSLVPPVSHLTLQQSLWGGRMLRNRAPPRWFWRVRSLAEAGFYFKPLLSPLKQFHRSWSPPPLLYPYLAIQLNLNQPWAKRRCSNDKTYCPVCCQGKVMRSRTVG